MCHLLFVLLKGYNAESAFIMILIINIDNNASHVQSTFHQFDSE